MSDQALNTQTGSSVWCNEFTLLFCSNCKCEWPSALRFEPHTLCQYLLMCVWMARWLGNVPLVWLGGTYKIILCREQTRASPGLGGRSHSTLCSEVVVIVFPPAFRHWRENACVLWQSAEMTLWQDVIRGGDLRIHRCEGKDFFPCLEEWKTCKDACECFGASKWSISVRTSHLLAAMGSQLIKTLHERTKEITLQSRVL